MDGAILFASISKKKKKINKLVLTTYNMGQRKYFLSYLLTYYSTGIQGGAKPSLNFKVILMNFVDLLIASSIEITVKEI
jgi:hypothetical protein